MKTIVVPKDLKAMCKLQASIEYEDKNLLNEYVFDDCIIYDLWNLHIFDRINMIANTIIDDYEEEEITDISKIKEVIEYLKGVQKKLDSPNIGFLLNIFIEANKRGTGVFFYF